MVPPRSSTSSVPISRQHGVNQRVLLKATPRRSGRAPPRSGLPAHRQNIGFAMVRTSHSIEESMSDLEPGGARCPVHWCGMGSLGCRELRFAAGIVSPRGNSFAGRKSRSPGASSRRFVQDLWASMSPRLSFSRATGCQSTVSTRARGGRTRPRRGPTTAGRRQAWRGRGRCRW